MLRGARQTGKSWLVRTWGASRFAQVIECNLERHPEMAACFSDNDPAATLRRLEVLLRRPIPMDGSTLLFLDEIQAAPEVLAKLRWFAEELPQVPVIAAGSLLDFALRDHAFSMPVGRITYLHLEPMGFQEFCLALDEERIVAWMRDEVTPDRIRAGAAMPEPLHQRAIALFRSWMLVGGMPAAVEAFRAGKSLLPVADLHRDLLATLRDDFAKYANRVHHGRLRAVLDAIPDQLGDSFSYARADREQRAAALRQAVDLLCLARVCHRVVASPAQGLPLAAGASGRAFKLLHLDLGLALTSLGLPAQALDQDSPLINRGALAEQAAGQLLRLTGPANEDPALFWWRRDRRGAEAELDYLLVAQGRIVPVEVKAGTAGTLKSLHAFMAERSLGLALRLNAAPPVIQAVSTPTTQGKAAYDLLSLPLYLTEEAPRLLGEVLSHA